ncbi:MAG: SdpI family protein [Oscillospiraceae bacterium]|nr:SdpI family protein [Oscillospiraceae bacterium]
MLKKNKTMIIITTLVALLPILVGLLLWDQLPEQIPSHWGIDGEVDSWSSKSFAVFFLPLMVAGIHLVCVFASSLDPKHHAYEGKMLQLVLWICPVLSLVISSLVYTYALGYDFLDVPFIMCLLVGIMFIIVGNYLPKCRQSYTMGIKLPWTLDDEGNWNATHRFGGWVWVICGVAMLATAFLGNFWVLLGVLLVAVILPTVYSYLYYRKHRKNG